MKLTNEGNPYIEPDPKAEGETKAGQGTGTSSLMLVFALAGIVCLVAGALYLTQITAGVGGIAAACFFGILARIAQAAHQHKALMNK